MKRLVYCFDGTWNDDTGETPITNVVKLYRSVLPRDKDSVEQIKRYIVGIATSFKGRQRFWMGAYGAEVGKRVTSAYAQLVQDYEPGDQIFLFGFSRGAYEARSLASFVSMFGIARKDASFSLDEAWELYRRHRADPVPAKLSGLRANAHYPVRIKCIGVWDTVGNLGNPLLPNGPLSRRLQYHDARLPETVDVGLHALSIDENRGPFSPTLWTLKKGSVLRPGQTFEQVWFAGSHADVGGGYAETELSDIGLMWMATRTTETTGLALDLEGLQQTTKPNPLGLQHAGATGQIFGWSKVLPFIRMIKQNRRALSYHRWAALGYWRTNLIANGQTSINESLHESVLQRYKKSVPEMVGEKVHQITYRPRNLTPVIADQLRADDVPSRVATKSGRMKRG